MNFSANQEDLQRKNSFNNGLNITRQSTSINLTQGGQQNEALYLVDFEDDVEQTNALPEAVM